MSKKIVSLYGEDYYHVMARENFEAAFERVLENDHYGALVLFEEALKFQPLNTEYAFYCGLSSYYTNESSWRHFQKAASGEPENAEYQMWYGISLYTEQNYETAKKVLLYAFSLDSKNPKIRIYYIKTLNQLKEFEAAEDFIKKSCDSERLNSDELFELGYAYWNRMMVEEAEREFVKSIEMNENNIISYYFLSRLYCREGEFGRAKEILVKLVNVCPQEEMMVEKQLKAIEMMEDL